MAELARKVSKIMKRSILLKMANLARIFFLKNGQIGEKNIKNYEKTIFVKMTKLVRKATKVVKRSIFPENG